MNAVLIAMALGLASAQTPPPECAGEAPAEIVIDAGEPLAGAEDREIRLAVLVRFDVAAEGRTARPHVVESDSMALDEPSLDAVRRRVYRAESAGGAAFSGCEIRFVYVFRPAAAD
ncbi:MAG: energy transducer TonB [Maricaulaceae bacterium]|nr:energy transducer TonB [Maricaulaceae bacterium]